MEDFLSVPCLSSALSVYLRRGYFTKLLWGSMCRVYACILSTKTGSKSHHLLEMFHIVFTYLWWVLNDLFLFWKAETILKSNSEIIWALSCSVGQQVTFPYLPKDNTCLLPPLCSFEESFTKTHQSVGLRENIFIFFSLPQVFLSILSFPLTSPFISWLMFKTAPHVEKAVGCGKLFWASWHETKQDK